MNMAAMHALVTHMREAETTLFVLLDPLAELQEDNPLQLDALAALLGDDVICRIPRPDLAHTPDLCPALIALATPGSPASSEHLKLLVDQVRQEAHQERRYVCGLLSSSASAEAVAAHILSLGQLPTEQGSRYFPVHEPLRLELLKATLNAGKQGLWWPIDRWLYPASSGASDIITAKCGGNDTPNECAATVQKEVPLVAALLSAWRRLPPSPLPYTPNYTVHSTPLPNHAAELAYTQIQQARERGLIRQDDLIVLALFQLTVHRQLQRHPRVSDLIDTAIAGQLSLGNLFRSYSDRDWERVVSDLIHTGIQP